MDFISLDEAWERLKYHVDRVERVEMVNLNQAVGCIVARTYQATMDNPPFDRSPLDGFACRSEDMAGEKALKIIDEIYAGMMSEKIVNQGECVRLMTGAPIPKGADCVIKQEDCVVTGNLMTYHRKMKHFENVVFQGEDIRCGDIVIEAGEKISKMHTCVLASVGIDKVEIKGQIKATLITTGDEVAQAGQKRQPAQIYDSTSVYLSATLKQKGVELCQHFCCLDSEEKLKKDLEKAILSSDFIITTGGVSVGERDIIEKVLLDMGAEIIFHGVKIKPGSPVMVAKLNGKVILSLSGNPFAALATFELIGRVILHYMDSRYDFPDFIEVINGKDYEKVRNHDAYVRAKLSGKELEIPDANHSSGSIRSMIGCNCLAKIPAGSALKKGDLVKVLLIDE